MLTLKINGIDLNQKQALCIYETELSRDSNVKNCYFYNRVREFIQLGKNSPSYNEFIRVEFECCFEDKKGLYKFLELN